MKFAVLGDYIREKRNVLAEHNQGNEAEAVAVGTEALEAASPCATA